MSSASVKCIVNSKRGKHNTIICTAIDLMALLPLHVILYTNTLKHGRRLQLNNVHQPMTECQHQVAG